MFAWTLDKFINPGHAAGVFENFYFIGGLGEEIMMVIGAAGYSSKTSQPPPRAV